MNSKNVQHEGLLPRVNACLSRFRLHLTDPVVVGLSGGKDSTSLMFVLRELGFRAIGVVIDLGYASFQAEAIATSTQKLGFEVVVISPRDDEHLTAVPSAYGLPLRKTLDALDAGDFETPCGLCSNAKRTVLSVETKRLGASAFCLGHHREDVVVTLLKDYFAARYHEVHGGYDRDRFIQFVAETTLDLGLMERLVTVGHVSTMGIRVGSRTGVTLLRPMAFVPEEQIEIFVQTSGIKTFGSGCSHSVFTTRPNGVATKREIVHSDWRRRLRCDQALGDKLLTLALLALDDTGRPKSNPRAVRTQLLPGFDVPKGTSG